VAAFVDGLYIYIPGHAVRSLDHTYTCVLSNGLLAEADGCVIEEVVSIFRREAACHNHQKVLRTVTVSTRAVRSSDLDHDHDRSYSA
jgi:hypothetical protein